MDRRTLIANALSCIACGALSTQGVAQERAEELPEKDASIDSRDDIKIEPDKKIEPYKAFTLALKKLKDNYKIDEQSHKYIISPTDEGWFVEARLIPATPGAIVLASVRDDGAVETSALY